MYYLQKFNSHAEFTAALGNNSTKLNNYAPWVVWDGEEVHYFNENTYKLGDTLTYDGHKLVCVIPSNTIDNGKARFIVADWYATSKWFNLKTDTDNTAYIDVVDLGYKQTITNYPNIATNPTDTTTNTISWARVSGQNGFSAIKDPLDYLTYWQTTADGHCPSPWIQNDVNSPLIYNTNYGIGTASGDFNGLNNTKVILNYYDKGPSGWTGTNGANAGTGSHVISNYQCAAKVLKDGLESSVSNTNIKYYLPSIGELGFLMARLQFINEKITSIGGTVVPTSGYIWSSTQYSANYAYYLNTGYGNLDRYRKYYGINVRAFVQL